MLVNNAGILRDKMSFNMTEEEWDAVIKVHLKGHFAPSQFAASYWRQKSKETGEPVNAKIVNTSSESGLYGNAGQANYAAAKAGIASLTIVLARELERFGVRVNAIAPVALHAPHRGPHGRHADAADGELEPLHPANVGRRRLLARLRPVRRHLRPGAQDPGRAAQIVQGWRPVTQINSDEALDDRVDRRGARRAVRQDRCRRPALPHGEL